MITQWQDVTRKPDEKRRYCAARGDKRNPGVLPNRAKTKGHMKVLLSAMETVCDLLSMNDLRVIREPFAYLKSIFPMSQRREDRLETEYPPHFF